MKQLIIILSIVAALVLIYGALYGVSDWPQAVKDLENIQWPTGSNN